MYIEKIQIKNFKLFRNITIFFNKNLNVFTGTNNSGKTTILEAVSLWQEIFNLLIIKENHKFIFNENKIYLDYKKLLSIRSSRHNGVFYNFDANNTIILEATINNDTDFLNIAFSLKSHFENIFVIELENKKKFNPEKFNQFFNLSKKEPAFLTFPASIDNLKSVEKFQTYVNIDSQIKNRNSISVLRNRIHDLKADDIRFNSFKEDLYYILNKDNQRADIDIAVKSDRGKDSIAKVDILIRNLFVDIYLLGSGTIQIIELLLSLYRKNDDAGLNLIMFDEPDNHIHRDIQIYLFRFIKKHIKNKENKQIFITTHNESLIRSLDPTELFHIEDKEYNNIEIKPVINEKVNYPKKGFQPTHHIKILESLGAASGLDIINAIESDTLILIEGKSDAKYIRKIYVKSKNNQSIMFWAFNGINDIFQNINNYKPFFKTLKLWNKAILIFDKDLLTDLQRTKLQQAFNEKIGIKTYIWKSYTIESTLFSDIDILNKLLSKYFKKLNPKINISDAEIEIKLKTSIKSKIKEKQQIFADLSIENIKNHVLWHKYTKQIKSAKKKTKDILHLKNIFNEDDIIWNEFTEYYKNKLNINDFHKIIDKNDVFDILKNIANDFNILIDESLYLSDIINLAGYDLWFDEWTNICNLIGNKSKKEEQEIIEEKDTKEEKIIIEEKTDITLKDFYSKINNLSAYKNKKTRLGDIVKDFYHTNRINRNELYKKYEYNLG